MKFLFSLITAIATMAGAANAAPVLASTDFILGGASDGANFTVGGVGFDMPGNNWPGAEGPEHLIDGVGQKYLNFFKENSGAVITPGSGSSVVTSLQLWTANDEVPRDPASYELYGTNDAITAATTGDTIDLSIFTLISSGPLALPDSRNFGGGAPLDDANSQTVSFANMVAYTTYLILFPTLKDSPNANSVQIGELQLFTTDPNEVPLPAALPLFLVGLAGLRFARRRKTA